MDINGYLEYKRPIDGYVYKSTTGEIVDSRWVIPYNPYLSVKYNAHINVEVCSTIAAIKYIHKYVYKGPDRARLIIQSENDSNTMEYNEIKQYLDMRYICAPEAMSRILEFNCNGRSHTVYRLAVHLKEQQTIVFEEGHEQEAANNVRDTTLTAWFKLNQIDTNARKYFYHEIPEHYLWVNKQWKPRKKYHPTIGRMFTVSPKEGERFFLRMLLLYRRGATSYEHLLIVGGVCYSTFKEAAIASGFLQDDEEYRKCLQDAARTAMPSQLRALFAYIITFCEVTNEQELWDEFKEHMINDFVYQGTLPELALSMAYNEIKKIAFECGKDITTVISSSKYKALEAFDVVVNANRYREEGERLYETLNFKQKEAADAILNIKYQCIFIDGPGGSGKTYLYNAINNLLIGRSKKVINVAWSGIAATLLPNGRTVHVAFKLPVPINDSNKTSFMKVQSVEAKELREVDAIIWDEAGMAPKQALEAVDLLLKDIMQTNVPFGGKQIILGGDFRQIPPVVPKASRTEVVRTSIKYSHLWNRFQQFSLTENMRAQGAGQNWANFLLELGNGDIGGEKDSFEVPADLRSSGDLINDIFGDIKTAEDIETLVDRAILTPKNYDSLEMNKKILSKLPGEEIVYQSIDEAVCDEGVDKTHFPTEFLNTLTPQSYPPHALCLKKEAIVMLLRNLRVKGGLCNGTRLIVKELSKFYLGCRVATGSSKGDYVVIPRVTFLPSNEDNSPFKLKRRQFPIRLAFAMTINKSQGQTFNRVGLYLSSPIFSHGQLYVACSRVRRRDQLKISVPNNNFVINNVVYKEILK